MAQFNPFSAPIDEMVQQTQDLMRLTPMPGPQVAHFWQTQDAVLTETETFAKHWFERPHTAVRTALDTTREVTRNGATDPAAALRAITDWQAGSLERLAEDVQGRVALWTRCAGHVTRADSEAGQEALETASQAAAAGTHDRESVPV